MKFRINTSTCSPAIALVLPLAVFGAQEPCPEGEPTSESYTWDFPGEASALLASVEAGANRAAELADRLAYYPTTTGESHARQLMNIRDEINDLGETLCRLQVIHRVSLPWKQNAIDRTLPQLKAMAADGENAILSVNENPGNLFNPEYRDNAGNLDETSRDLATMLNNFQEYAQAKSDMNRLEHTLELRSAS